jgi:signal transduction histidine kinase
MDDNSESVERTNQDIMLQEIRRISSELSHDLTGPLQIIRNCTYLLKLDPSDVSPTEDIDNSVNKIIEMLDNFREYYKGSEISKYAMDFNPIMERVLEEVFIPDNVKVNYSHDPDIDEVSIDPVKMKKSLYYLIKTAVDSMPNGGNLSVETSNSENSIEIIISDTGNSIPESQMGDILKPFGSKNRESTGLALPSCGLVIKAHGGTIDYTSGAIGTTFTVTLPKQ